MMSALQKCLHREHRLFDALRKNSTRRIHPLSGNPLAMSWIKSTSGYCKSASMRPQIQRVNLFSFIAQTCGTSASALLLSVLLPVWHTCTCTSRFNRFCLTLVQILFLYLCVCPQTGQVHSYFLLTPAQPRFSVFIVLVCLSADWTGAPVLLVSTASVVCWLRFLFVCSFVSVC
jgi:hypothetical protein